jgi:hypothetical protein
MEMINSEQKMEIRKLKNLWVQAKLDGNTNQANALLDMMYVWYIANLRELTLEQCRTFEIFFHMNDYL